jgi:hypothetical protein
MGGLCAVTLSFLIPTICYVKLSEHPWTHCSNLSRILFFGILIIVGYSSVGITVYTIITGKPVMPSCRGDGSLEINDDTLDYADCQN